MNEKFKLNCPKSIRLWVGVVKEVVLLINSHHFSICHQLIGVFVRVS